MLFHVRDPIASALTRFDSKRLLPVSIFKKNFSEKRFRPNDLDLDTETEP